VCAQLTRRRSLSRSHLVRNRVCTNLASRDGWARPANGELWKIRLSIISILLRCERENRYNASRVQVQPLMKLLTDASFGFLSGLVDVFAWVMRALERVLPQVILNILSWPSAVIWNATERGKQHEVRVDWYRFPAPWRPNRLRYTLTQNLALTHSRFVYLWTDRLHQKRWLKHCHFRGHYDLQAFRESPRPIIFVTLHFGPLQVLPVWLRAQNIPVTMLVGPAEPRQRLRQRFSRMSEPANIPLLLPVGEICHIRSFLGPHRRLLISMDVNRGKQVVVEHSGYSFRLASGALRMAAVSGADVVPCLITFEKGAWNIGVHFGAPVPREYLGRTPDIEAAASHLIGEFLPVVTSYPHLMSPRFLRSITSSGVETAAAV
jgi:lauroyl/myristoyl acyltransferase